jgi:fimbrial chaperone protein
MMRLPVLFLILISYGFTLTPMSQSIDPQSKIKQGQFLIDNSTNEQMAIEVSVHERIQKSDGTEEMPKTTELMAFPPQLIVPPKEKRTIRVQWVGEIKDVEKAFRVVAEQLPLDMNDKKNKKTGIKMLLKYVAAFYVTPKNTEAKINVNKVELKGSDLFVTVTNSGTRHQLLQNAVLSLKSESQAIKLEEEDLKGLTGQNILAKSTRVFKLKAPKNITNDMQGTLKFD